MSWVAFKLYAFALGSLLELGILACQRRFWSACCKLGDLPSSMEIPTKVRNNLDQLAEMQTVLIRGCGRPLQARHCLGDHRRLFFGQQCVCRAVMVFAGVPLRM